MYDWANSAYVTTVAVGLLPRYFADVVVPPGGIMIGGTTVAADTLWAIIVGAATLIAFVTSPVLGAVADFSSAKKRFLLTFAWIGSLFTVLLYFCRAGDVVTTLVFFLVAQVGFIAANVFYDAFLPHIASPGRMDWWPCSSPGSCSCRSSTWTRRDGPGSRGLSREPSLSAQPARAWSVSPRGRN